MPDKVDSCNKDTNRGLIFNFVELNKGKLTFDLDKIKAFNDEFNKETKDIYNKCSDCLIKDTFDKEIAIDKGATPYKDSALEDKEVTVQKYKDRLAYIRSDGCYEKTNSTLDKLRVSSGSQQTIGIIQTKKGNVYIGCEENPVTKENLSESIKRMLDLALSEIFGMSYVLSIKSFSVDCIPRSYSEDFQNEGSFVYEKSNDSSDIKDKASDGIQLSEKHPLYEALLEKLVEFTFNIHDNIREYHNRNNIDKIYKINDIKCTLKKLGAILKAKENLSANAKFTTEELLRNISQYSKVGLRTTDDFRDKILNLSNDYPNMHKVYDYIIQSMTVNKYTEDELFYFKPLLIVGPKGIGKTSFLYKMANLIDLPCSKIDFSGVSANFVLTGSTSQWSGAEHGKIFEALSKSYPVPCINNEGKEGHYNIYKHEQMTFENPIIILDELDKCSTTHDRDPYGVLHGLLEKDTAKEFTDEHMKIPIDASKINWVATANDITSIPETILDRFYIIELEELKDKEFLVMAKSVYKDFSKDIVKECKPISDQCILSLHKAGVGLRQFQKILYLAFEGFDDYTQINETKIAELIQGVSNKKSKIGF